MENEKIDAFSFWNGNRPFIFMASDKESVARHRYDLAHELGHLILHKWVEAEELKVPKYLSVSKQKLILLLVHFCFHNNLFPMKSILLDLMLLLN